jgi:PAS domain S-box-containing protein
MFRRAAVQAVLGCLGLVLVSVFGRWFHAGALPVSLASLLLVIAMSVRTTSAPSLVVAVISPVFLQPFFSPPGTIADYWLRDLVLVGAFSWASLLITGLRARLGRAVDDVRELQQRIQQVVDTVPALIWRTSAEGSGDFFSQRWLEYTGLALYQGLGSGWISAVHAEDRHGFVEAWHAAINAGSPLEAEARLQRADGAARWFLIRARPLLDAQGAVHTWYASAVDIEDRRRDELALREREITLAEQACLLDLTHDSVFVRDSDDVITYWNGGAEELYGWRREQTLGRVSHQLLETSFPAPLEQIMATLSRNGRWEGELTQLRSDGSRVVVASRWVAQNDEAGRRIATMEASNDITAQRRAEAAVRAVQAELAHVARITTMGEMATTIAHEVNQPLSGVVINGNACLRWLARESPNLNEAREAIENIIRDGKRASEVITRIRNLSRKSGAEKEPVDLNEAIAEVAAFAEGELRRARVRLRTELAPELPRVMGDRVQLQQVVLNLVVNGIEAMSSIDAERRELVIETRPENQAQARVAVRDSGIGLDADNINRIFDAFYTTKREGMGMGLSISRSIIENHGGRLWAEANEGPGTTFHFAV